MRAAGVRRVRLEHAECPYREIELEPPSPDTIPAPEMADPEPVEDKPATECSHAGCHEPKGFSFAPQYCERHGLKALGVST
jgi:hypothetical protein